MFYDHGRGTIPSNTMAVLPLLAIAIHLLLARAAMANLPLEAIAMSLRIIVMDTRHDQATMASHGHDTTNYH